MNHLGDTNKMVSDTPRTDEAEVWHEEASHYHVVGSFLARQLERELNEANDRIKRLEAVVNDPHALWTNWLRGDVKLPAGIGDVRQYQDRIKRLEEAIQERDKEWFQVIESILGFHPVSMTEALRIGIERIKKQKQRIKRLDEENNELRAEEARLLNTKGELERRIKRLEEMYEGVIGERPELLGSNVMGLLKRELNFAQKRIKRLEEAGDRMRLYCADPDDCFAWDKAKETKQ